MANLDDYKSILSITNPTFYLDKRQRSAVQRFIPTTGCGLTNWGILLIHKVGTGKTISSLLIAINNLEPRDEPHEIIIISPVGIFNGFIDDLKKLIIPEGNIGIDFNPNDPFKNFQCLARKITVDGKNVLEAYFSNVNVLLFVKKFANLHKSAALFCIGVPVKTIAFFD